MIYDLICYDSGIRMCVACNNNLRSVLSDPLTLLMDAINKFSLFISQGRQNELG